MIIDIGLRTGEEYQYVFKGARSAPRAGRRVVLGEVTRPCGQNRGWRARRGGRMRPRDSSPGGLAAPPLHLRRTAGRRPSATQGTVRHQLATVTPPTALT
jgi:hypothetical protein